MSRLYVGNLPYTFTQADLERIFGPYGPVKSAQVITDRNT
ncbi:MAG: RNA-binding protein, partial [Planctomycetota bacterium]